MKRAVRNLLLLSPRGGIRWLLRDEFSDTRAAGAVNGTAATPGPGTRVVVDANSKLTVGAGVLNFATGGSAIGNPGLWWDIQTRTAGRVLVGAITPSGVVNAHAGLGWDGGQAGALTDSFNFAAGGLLQFVANGATALTVGAFTAVAYKVAMVHRATGMYVFIKGGAFTNWTLLWSSAAGVANAYPGVGALGTTSVFTADFARIPEALWLPQPACYDTFTRANGVLGNSEIVGPDAQGVAARAWESGGATWAIASNEAVNTPTEGAELWDGPASVFTAGTYGWAVYGTNTIANDANSLKITYVDNAGGAYDRFRDTTDLNADLTVGQWYMFHADAKVGVGNSVNLAISASGGVVDGPVITDVAFAAQTHTFRAASIASDLIRCTNMSAGEILWLDNLSLKPLTLNTLFTDVDDTATANVVAQVELDTVVAGTQAGLVLNLDSAAAPANFVIAYHDGVNARLDKCVAGTYTSVISAAAAYAAGATMVVVKDSTSYSLYYNNAQVGATSTISDAGIISNTKHGLFSTYSGNQLDNFLVMPRAGSAYSALDRWSS